MRVGAFTAMTMLAGFCAGHVITDPLNAAATATCLIAASFFCGLAFSGDVK